MALKIVLTVVALCLGANSSPLSWGFSASARGGSGGSAGGSAGGSFKGGLGNTFGDGLGGIGSALMGGVGGVVKAAAGIGAGAVGAGLEMGSSVAGGVSNMLEAKADMADSLSERLSKSNGFGGMTEGIKNQLGSSMAEMKDKSGVIKEQMEGGAGATGGSGNGSVAANGEIGGSLEENHSAGLGERLSDGIESVKDAVTGLGSSAVNKAIDLEVAKLKLAAGAVGAGLEMGSSLAGGVSNMLGAKADMADSLSERLSKSNGFGGMTEGIKNQLGSSMAEMKDKSGVIKEQMEGGAGQLKNKLELSMSEIKEKMGGLKEQMGGRAGELKNKLESSMSKIKEELGGLKEQMEGGAGVIGGSGSGSVATSGEIEGSLEENRSASLGEKLADGIKSVKDAVTGLGSSAVNKAIDLEVAKLKLAAGAVGAGLEMGSSVAGGVSNMLGAKADMADSLSERLSKSNGFGGMTEGIKNQLGSSMAEMKDKSGVIKEQMEGGAGQLKNKLEFSMSEVKEKMGGLKEQMEGGAGQLKNKLESSMSKINEKMGGLKEQMGGGAGATGGSGNGGEIGGSLEENHSAGLGERLADGIESVKDAVTGFGSTAVNKAIDLEVAKLKLAADAAQAVSSKLYKAANKLEESKVVGASPSESSGRFMDKIKNEIKEAKDQLAEFKENISTVASTNFDEIKSAVGKGVSADSGSGASADGSSDIGGYEKVSFVDMKEDLIGKKNQMYQDFNKHVQLASEKSGKSVEEITASHAEGLKELSELSDKFNNATTKEDLWSLRKLFVSQILKMQAEVDQLGEGAGGLGGGKGGAIGGSGSESVAASGEIDGSLDENLSAGLGDDLDNDKGSGHGEKFADGIESAKDAVTGLGETAVNKAIDLELAKLKLAADSTQAVSSKLGKAANKLESKIEDASGSESSGGFMNTIKNAFGGAREKLAGIKAAASTSLDKIKSAVGGSVSSDISVDSSSGASADGSSDIGGYEKVSFVDMKEDLIGKKNQMYEDFNKHVQLASEKSGKSVEEITASHAEGLKDLSELSDKFDNATTKEDLWYYRTIFVPKILKIQADVDVSYEITIE